MSSLLAGAVLAMATNLWAVGAEEKMRPQPTLIQDVPAAGAGILNLNCMTALIAIEHFDLTGTFSFIAEKDTAAALAEFLVRNKQAQKKYIYKLQKDIKETMGISVWDHAVIMRSLEIYASPVAEIVEKPAPGVSERLTQLSLTPTLTNEEMSLRRKS